MVAAARREEETWDASEEDEEALSLIDLPVVDCGEDRTGGCGGDDAAELTKAPEADDFEFRTFSGELDAAEACMCAADEVFFQGQILPLRPSVSSDGGVFTASRCGSRSESMERLSSAAGSLGFESSRSLSGRSSRSLSGRSSSSISRSQSTRSSHSSSSPNEVTTRLPVAGNFCALPSPKPHVYSRRKSATGPARKSSSAAGAGWGLLRLGLLRTPEINLDDLRLRKASAGRTMAELWKAGDHDGPTLEKKPPKQGNGSGKEGKPRSGGGGCPEEKNPGTRRQSSRSFGSRLRCRCSPDDAVIPRWSGVMMDGTARREGWRRPTTSSSLNCARKVMCYSRTFEWLTELPAPKAPAA
ncbi:unnamed protein product [Spirodela intermedia]|uniref:Uncharacterized protein n=1 Tax=Spirodela intermedia TaxID=51605 RepID=A0A7I8IIF3_SPIIN|nr:unnamed protein product [Spirodela intermedia]CAA6657496.1 unnamed protein product [Spirodela intermedia]